LQIGKFWQGCFQDATRTNAYDKFPQKVRLRPILTVHKTTKNIVIEKYVNVWQPGTDDTDPR
jgi:hypothetical protein